jgi:hypothetical protein
MLLLCYAFNSFIRSSRVMARCSPLGEVVVANVAEKENVVETKKCDGGDAIWGWQRGANGIWR